MIIYDQSKTLPHTKYNLINLSRRASEIAVLHLRNPNTTESSTSQRWVLHLPPKIQSVRVTKLRLCKSRFSGTLFLLPISICLYTCVSVWWLLNTKLGLDLFVCFGGRHVGRWETAVLHLRWPTVPVFYPVLRCDKIVEIYIRRFQFIPKHGPVSTFQPLTTKMCV